MSNVEATPRVPLFEARGLEVAYRARGRITHAVDGIDLVWEGNDVLGLVGESGCGKSTLGRALLGLQPATAGEVRFDGRPLSEVPARGLRRRVQMIFQDPYQSLDPRHPIGEQVMEGLAIHRIGEDRVARVTLAVRAMENAGLVPAERFWSRYPHELSGGQRQRAMIAGALALDPEALICDEPVSALDVSVRAQVLHLLARLREERDLGYLFITHDLGLAWTLCDRVAVMYLGRIVEIGATEQVFGAPRHPYTKALLSVVPSPQRRGAAAAAAGKRTILAGEVPDASAVPSGCRFHPRCPIAQDRCRTVDPALESHGTTGDHAIACHLAGNDLDRQPPVATTI
jgi:peptide/nickel transport system ATP-binding protein